MGAKKLRKQAAAAAALAELEQLTQLGKVVRTVQAAVAGANLQKSIGRPAGDAELRDYIAKGLASPSLQVRAGAMAAAEQLDGVSGALDEQYRIAKSRRTR